MEIAVFTQDGCVNCEMFKDVLKSQGLSYKEHDAGLAFNPGAKGYFEKNPDWRTNGVVPAMGVLQIDRTLPIVVINDKAYNYEEALRKVAATTTPVQFNSKVKCEEGVCVLA